MSKSGGSDSKNTLYCSFCGKSQHEVRKLIAGPTVFICDECVELCMDIIREEHKSTQLKSRDGVPTPKEICEVLDDYVIGQAQATAAALVNQREIFQNVNRNLDAIGSRFPMVNNLLQAIRRKRSKDTMVLATVVAICTAFTLIYWLSK